MSSPFDGTRVGYVEALKMFSRNARLYILHVIGMDMIHGTFMVLFNLYLLAIGFDVRFVGIRLVLAGVAGTLFSVPAGWVSDRIGRKASFIVGDGVGALLGLMNILTLNKPLLMSTAVIGAFFNALHHVSEPPFMHENSSPPERVHLFGVASGLRTLSAMVGSLFAGFVPLLLAPRVGLVTAYRVAAFIGLGMWWMSLVPALMLRRTVSEEPGERPPLFRNIPRPRLMAKLVIPELFVALGAGLVLPLGNVFMSEGFHAHEHQIGTTFALGQGFLALGALAAPFLAARMTKVQAVVWSRSASLPFVLLLALAGGHHHAGWALPLVMVAWSARTAIFNLSSPLESAFNMEILTLRERATLAGLDVAAFSSMTALGSFISSRLMAGGDFARPFVGMALLHAAGTYFFWRFFRESAQKAPFAAETEPVPEAAGTGPS